MEIVHVSILQSLLWHICAGYIVKDTCVMVGVWNVLFTQLLGLLKTTSIVCCCGITVSIT